MYRIKQISENIFIAQYKKWYWNDWKSIDKFDDYLWSIDAKDTFFTNIDSAKEAIKNYKKYPKYFKV